MKKIRVEIEEEVKDKVCIGCRFLFDDYVARAKCLLYICLTSFAKRLAGMERS